MTTQDGLQVFAALRERSRLTATDVAAGPAAPRWLPPQVGAPTRTATALPPVRTVAAPQRAGGFDQLLRDRSSVRFYRDEPVAVEAVAAAVRYATLLDREGWPAEHAVNHSLTFVIAALNVTGLDQAFYRADPDDAAFVPLAPLADREVAREMVLQVEFADAPVILSVTGSLSVALERHGEHGHRSLLSRASGAAYAALLHAQAHGLAGSVFAGFLESAVRPLVGLDGFRRRQLFALSFGHPLGST